MKLHAGIGMLSLTVILGCKPGAHAAGPGTGAEGDQPDPIKVSAVTERDSSTVSVPLLESPTTWTLLPGVVSQVSGGFVQSTVPAGAGKKTAVWTATNLRAGYYKVEVLYPRHYQNASCVLVETKGTLDTTFKARPIRLNQQIGDQAKTRTTVYLKAVTNMTPYAKSNAASYIWVSKNAAGVENTGSLAVRFSDLGCSTGLIVADAVRMTWISSSQSTSAVEPVALPSNAKTISSYKVEGPTVWSVLSAAKSQLVGGAVYSTTANGDGKRMATWSASGLQQAYYKVEVLYPRSSLNAKCVLVSAKGTLDAGFKARSKRLNQQLGDGVTTPTTPLVNTVTNVTPYATSNAASYIWVGMDVSNKEYTGKLAVRLSDSGCSQGRIVADAIRITAISTKK